MKRAGCTLAVVGVLLAVASAVLFGSSIFRALAAHEAGVASIAAGGAAETGLLEVETAKFCQVAVRGLVRSTHARRGTGDSSDWNLQYAFPLHYAVYDADGNLVHEQTADFASEAGTHSVSNARVTADGGSAHIEQGFDKFAVTAPGRIRVEATLGTDRDFGATVESAKVVLYDNVSKHAGRVGIGVALLVLGGGLVMAGAVLLIVAAAKSGSA